jgi:hypothetical protein
MTAVVGVLCEGGVVVGTDSSATFAHDIGPEQQAPTIEQCMDKLRVVGDSVIVVGTGAVGLGQRFCAIVEKAWKGKKMWSVWFGSSGGHLWAQSVGHL